MEKETQKETINEVIKNKMTSTIVQTINSNLFWKITGILLLIILYIFIIYFTYEVCYKGMFGFCMFILGGVTCSILTYKLIKALKK